MQNIKTKAFTLVELLVVVGIVGILAVIMLINLNPAEAQRRTRDAQRIKDLLTIQNNLESLMANGTDLSASVSTRTSRWSDVRCNVNWTAQNFCAVSQQPVPRDPRHVTRTSFITGAGATVTVTAPVYRFTTDTTNTRIYKISAQLESETNAAKLLEDGGEATGVLSSADWFEVFNDERLAI